MRTDHLDLVQVHMSPSRSELEQQDTVGTMRALRDEGKVRFLGMSGILPDLADHIAMGVFDAFQIPYSAVEREHETAIADAAATGAGTIIRGGVAKGVAATPKEALERMSEPWRSRLQVRVDRWQDADLDDLLDEAEMDPMEFMLRFTLSHPDLDTTIVGTSNPDHLAGNIAIARKGPLPPDLYEQAKKRLSAAG
jgi:aryl-alcohol dehydrogenase-like predicted oxidoreductase